MKQQTLTLDLDTYDNMLKKYGFFNALNLIKWRAGVYIYTASRFINLKSYWCPGDFGGKLRFCCIRGE